MPFSIHICVAYVVKIVLVEVEVKVEVEGRNSKRVTIQSNWLCSGGGKFLVGQKAQQRS